jgi:hypothetical protein
MRNIKLLAFILALVMTGTVYAAGLTQDVTHTNATATEKPGCCEMHQADDKKSTASAQDTCDMKDGGCCKTDCREMHAEKSQASTHAEGCDCCSGVGCPMHKKHPTAAKVNAVSKGDAGGCASADCCKAHHATATEATADKGDHQGCCASCRMAHGAGR